MKCSGGTPPCDRCRKANSLCVFEPPNAAPPQSTAALSRALMPFECSTHPDTQPLIMCASAPPHQLRNLAAEHHEPRPSSCTSADTPAYAQQPSLPDGRFILNPPGASPSLPLPSLDNSGHELMLSPPDSNGFHRQKRRRVSSGPNVDNINSHSNDTNTESSASGPDTDISDASSPYHTVKAFEAAYWRANDQERLSPRTPISCIETRPGLVLEAMFPQSITDRGPLLYYLSEVGISMDDAKDMFSLFGERVAPFMPALYNADFSELPNDPIYTLASLKVMARYLPGVNALRSKVDLTLQSLLRNILFDDLRRPFDTALESMRGLAIIYGYSEVGAARSQLDTQQSEADALSIKGIIEGYAVRRNIGRPRQSNVLGCILWLWLYTMNINFVNLLGCPPTLSADERLSEAIAVVKQGVSHPQIDVLLGEVDLCRIAQSRRSPMLTASLTDGPRDYDDWVQTWGPVESQPVSVGRRLRFHFRFAMFHQHGGRKGPAPTDREALNAAQAFLQCITKLSPVSKGRIKYMCDFGFVMLVSVCCYILQALDALKTQLVDVSHQASCLDDIGDVADLLKSISSAPNASTTACGRALEAACDKFSTFISPAARGRANQEGEWGGGQAFGAVDQAKSNPLAEPGHVGPKTVSIRQPSHGLDADCGMQQGDATIETAAGLLGDDGLPWFGVMSDIPGGGLPDTLCIAWQN
ncbi:hypothetical protein NW767_014795 [Fusarium falciforme]|nr:hypothetical protein NW767_014795 [Fusarium falciforme]